MNQCNLASDWEATSAPIAQVIITTVYLSAHRRQKALSSGRNCEVCSRTLNLDPGGKGGVASAPPSGGLIDRPF